MVHWQVQVQRDKDAGVVGMMGGRLKREESSYRKENLQLQLQDLAHNQNQDSLRRPAIFPIHPLTSRTIITHIKRDQSLKE